MAYLCVVGEGKVRGMGLFITCGMWLVSLQVVLASDDPIRERQCGLEASSNALHHDPWVVFLEFYRRGRLTELRCAGTLISARYVLTAAHCVTNNKYKLQARLGDYDVSTAQECVDGVCADPIVRIAVADVIIHPAYETRKHDIALLKLAEDAPYTDFIRYVCLPSGQLEDATSFHAAGWGEVISTGMYSRVKKSIPLPGWSYDRCQRVFHPDNVPNHVICAGGQKEVDTCRGDSGGPLMRTKDRVEIWGITSSGAHNCGTSGKPGIYTSVVDYTTWILEEILKQ